MSNEKEYFVKKLLGWNTKENDRQMPWKAEKDPYKIWLSEIILQQTRVEQGWEYYNRFIKKFPDVKKLAAAPSQKVFKLWEGLGYYTRCKNLIATAKYIAKEKQGKFPGTYQEILALKGIGPYTAAAIASFAFNLPHAVVDGNVFRVLSRFFGIDAAIDSTAGKHIFTDLAGELLEKKLPGIYNQAIMDFGAVICKPRNPLCNQCPLKSRCAARLQGKVDLLPVKNGKMIKKKRWFYYLVAVYNSSIYVRKRGAGDIWENLHEFILLETEKPVTVENLKTPGLYNKIGLNNSAEISHISRIYKQQLTHQTIHGCFIRVKLKNALPVKGYRAIAITGLNRLAFPKLITIYLSENELPAFER